MKKSSAKKYGASQIVPVIEEPALKYEAMRVILGGKSSLQQPLAGDYDLIKLIRGGVKKSSLKSLAAYLNISMDTLSGLLHTSHRNIQRKDDEDLLDSLKTEKVLELAAFAQRGTEVIGSKEAFSEWLQSPLVSIGNKRPLDFLDTSFGIQLMLQVLGRLEHGVYS